MHRSTSARDDWRRFTEPGRGAQLFFDVELFTLLRWPERQGVSALPPGTVASTAATYTRHARRPCAGNWGTDRF